MNHSLAVAGHVTPKGHLVSVITVCRNAGTTLEACLISVARQTYRYIEHIVIDGQSTDGTSAILERHRCSLATVVSEPDNGIYDAMNKGLDRAHGEFILFINADDRLVGPSVIADAMSQIALAPDLDVYYGALELLHDGQAIRHDPPPSDRALQEMVLGCLPHQATFARRSVFEKTGPFDLRWRRHADYDWWLKVLGDPTIRLSRINTMVTAYALGGASSDLERGQPEVFAIQNTAAVFRTPEWDRRRIEMYQQALLAMRIAEAKRTAHKDPRRQQHLANVVRSLLMRGLLGPAMQAIRAAKRRLTAG